MNRMQYYLKHTTNDQLPRFTRNKTYRQIEHEGNLHKLCNTLCVETRLVEELGLEKSEIGLDKCVHDGCMNCWMKSMPPHLNNNFNSLLEKYDGNKDG